ncbi:NACHT domain-containing protein [Janthinobacterium rivuli]|uniref:NACHT domain-containing protein n=1 Tax=Janthinobacterium rivuli TaxID=2751478 RepID=A0ABY8HX00_9BURK|nr:NACHT domain-containing protein [Janthinobacterium rivuli]WFR77125.1 NACHT domain-containing protein [Janthinobacterium rivuli]
MLAQRKELLIKKIQDMSELDFTKKILMPLFTSLGYAVNYNGGASERGKDLICKKDGEFGSVELTVVQVKKTRPNAVASDSRSLSEIITQLQQASEENVPLISGIYQKPNKVYFITPFEIDVRALESRFAALAALSLKNVRVLDGPLIVDSLQRQLPHLADAICGDEFVIKSGALAGLSNSDLLSALNYANEKEISDFYCDLDFSVGRITSKLFFALNFAPRKIQQSITGIRWGSLCEKFRIFTKATGRELIEPSIADVEINFEKKWKLWESQENRELLRSIWVTVDEIENLLKFIIDEAGDIVETVFLLSSPNAVFSTKKIRDLSDDEYYRLSQLRLVRTSLEGQHANWFASTEINSEKILKIGEIITAAELHIEALRDDNVVLNAIAATRLTALLKNVVQLNDLFNRLEIAAASKVSEPTFDFTIDGSVVAGALIEYRKWVTEGADSLAVGGEQREKVRLYFLRCQEIFELVELVLSEKLFADAAGVDDTQKFAIVAAGQRIHLPLKDVFATGIHCAVYGEAGAGKSTTLHRYASSAASSDKADEITLWIPLTRILHRDESYDNDEISGISKLERAISKFFGGGAAIHENEVIPLIKSKKRAVFIFDGIDEVIRRSPWIILAIQEVCVKYNNCQVIVSARSTGSYPELRNFLGLTLLPFNDEQVSSFVNGWFKEDVEMGCDVVKHLAKVHSVAEIVRNPLLATVLCVLAENKVPLPSGELAMYEERMKLLLGHYDIHKKTRRLHSHHSLLETTARQIAFQLHIQNIRSVSVESLETFAIRGLDSVVPKISYEAIRKAVNELIDPCNILVPMTDEGAFGFGHLRYQEFLSAKELHNNRSIDILPLLTSSWWRPVIVLFCRLGGKVDFIINEVIGKEHTVDKYKDTLLAIIATRGKNEQRYLKGLISEHQRMDALNDNFRDLSDSSSDFDDIDSLGIDFDRRY